MSSQRSGSLLTKEQRACGTCNRCKVLSTRSKERLPHQTVWHVKVKMVDRWRMARGVRNICRQGTYRVLARKLRTECRAVTTGQGMREVMDSADGALHGRPRPAAARVRCSAGTA